jgi:hypothetical protein
MKITRPVKKPVIIILIKKASFFLVAMCSLALLLYLLGNIQGFMDKTERILLRATAAAGICLAFSSLAGIFFTFLMFLSGKFRYIGGVVAYALMVLFGIAAAVFSSSILVLANGF